jgi:hypothetical protein
MKKIIFSALLLTSIAANAEIITFAGEFEGTISGGNVYGKCKKTTGTCWKYNTVDHTLTIYLFTVPNVLPNATEPILDESEDAWSATYEE